MRNSSSVDIGRLLNEDIFAAGKFQGDIFERACSAHHHHHHHKENKMRFSKEDIIMYNMRNSLKSRASILLTNLTNISRNDLHMLSTNSALSPSSIKSDKKHGHGHGHGNDHHHHCSTDKLSKKEKAK